MIAIRPLAAALGALALAVLSVPRVQAAETAAPAQYLEPPYLAGRVQAGELPPVAERVPDAPSVASFEGSRSIGQYGGQMRWIMGRIKDLKMLTVYGYARLVAYDRNLELVPDILKDVEVEEGRIFTLHLRPGHRWSDGHPFTAEDFRYFWEDIATNEEMSPTGLPQALTVNDQPPTFEVIDKYTVRYAWPHPNPFFLPALAGAAPLYIYKPAHYLKQFHADYQEPEQLEELVEEAGERNWVGLQFNMGRQYRFDNPALPTLQPWRLLTEPPGTRFIAARNPYFHRVDPNGRQLPYIDEVAIAIADSNLIPPKAGAGEADLQARNLAFADYTFLKQGEDVNNYEVRLWHTAQGSHVALYPNLNTTDEQWRRVFREVDFRRALSMGVNRHEINQVIYYGLAREANNTVLPRSPLYKEEYAEVWTDYDLKAANRLLDGLGLTERNSRGIRLFPNGEPMELIVETAGESSEQSDVLQLVHDSWLELGIKVYTKPLQREVFRNRVFAGSTAMSVWSGLENGIPTPDTSPEEIAPTNQLHLQWPKWGQHYQTNGAAGEPIDMPKPKRLLELNEAWVMTPDREERAEIWHEMLKIFTNQVYTIGLISSVRQPVVVNNRLRNVPEEGIYNWDPGAHFGIYRPDTFWFENAQSAAADAGNE